MSSAANPRNPDEDRDLPLGTFSPRQELISELLRLGLDIEGLNDQPVEVLTALRDGLKKIGVKEGGA